MASSSTRRQRKISCRRNIDSELSFDIVQLIFSKLNFINLSNCRAVCKAWNKLILYGNSYASIASINSQLVLTEIFPSSSMLHYVDLDPKHLEGISMIASLAYNVSPFSSEINIFNSCNGLLLCSTNEPSFRGVFRDVVCIFNPITNEYIRVFYPKKKKAYRYWLGFALNTNRYKIIRYSFIYKIVNGSSSMVSMKLLRNVLAFEIDCYGKWTRVECDINILQDEGTYFNGALYWVGVITKHQVPQPVYTFAVYRFDLEDEDLEEISFSQFENPSGGQPFGCLLGFMNDSLYLTFQWPLCGDYQVWKMEEDFLWIKVFVVPNPLTSLHVYQLNCLQLIKACEDGQILCFFTSSSDLILYDPKTQTIQILTNQHQIVKAHLELYKMSCISFDPLHQILETDLC